MTLETANTVAQLVASGGVIGSLFYLAVQVRQNTRSSRAVVVDSLARSIHELTFTMASDPELLRIVTTIVANWETATEVERARASSFFLGYFKVFENAWFQMRQGTLSREQWQGYEAFVRMVYYLPAVQTWWPMRRAFFASGFRDFLERCEKLPDVPTLGEIIQTER